MNIVARIAEQRIREAQARGELDGLPGAGKPLKLEEDNPFVPPELRMAYRVLKNAGFIPPEVELRRDIHSLEQLLACATDAGEQRQAARRLEALRWRLSMLRPHAPLHIEERYREQACRRLG